jgi:anthranilate synthase/aminodeoxychorismate synthase-like glutamine amidotransferase
VQLFGVLGAEVSVFLNDQTTPEALAAARFDAVILSPGPGTPNDAGITLGAIERLMGHTPLFGVCLGHQAMAQVLGANVVRARRPLHGKAQPIFHTGLFAGVRQGLNVARYNSLVVEEASLPEAVTIGARSGEGEIMAIEVRERKMWGVQFHPESAVSEGGAVIAANWLRLATGWQSPPDAAERWEQGLR